MAAVETISPERDSTGRAHRAWTRRGRRYSHALLVVDVLAASTAALVMYEWRLTQVRDSVLLTTVTFAMPVIWVGALAIYRCYHRYAPDLPAHLGHRVVQAGLGLAAVMSSACLVLRHLALVDHILFGIPLAVALTILGRRLACPWLRGRRGAARRGLVVGRMTAISGLLAELDRDRSRSIEPVAACAADGISGQTANGLPVTALGNPSDIAGIARQYGTDVVIVSPSAELDFAQLRQLGWDLQGAGVELLVAPALSDVSRERVSLWPAGGLPLLHVRAPVFSGPQRVLKGLIDRILAGVLLVVLAPAMLLIALLVRLSGPGAAIFRQPRVGRDGKEFMCLKFRSMTSGAHVHQPNVDHLNERRDSPMFKIRVDPRVTKIGAVLRRYSLDELPQLVNVLRGEMSLVGPRPPLPEEAARFEAALRRRLLVKPGMTGLWQVSGRADLSWSESVRLDLSYVDNWSPALDLRILLRTVVVVIRGTGAY